MTTTRSLSAFRPLLLLLPVLFLGAAAAMYFLYQDKLEAAELARDQAIQAEADSRLALVNTQVRDLRAQVIQTGELLLRQLPLPLSNLPLILLRELDQDMARREMPWGEVFVVSLDPDARQFHYESRQFQTNLLFLATQGESVGPQAIPLAEGFELFIAEPLSSAEWVVVARVREDGLSTQLSQGLIGVDQVVLEQLAGNADAMELYRFGETPAAEPVYRNTNVTDWRLSFAPSQAFLDRYANAGRMPYLLIYVFTALTLVSAALAAWLLVKGPGLALQQAEVGAEGNADQPRRRSAASKAFAEEADEDVQDAQNEAQASDALRAEDDFVALTADRLPVKIFRANDIRGLAGEQLTEDFARHLGRCFAPLALASGAQRVFVGRDTRKSSESLCRSLIQGLLESGCDVVDVGLCATPLLAWCMKQREGTAAIMVTASHSPPDYNGFKLVLGGVTLHGDRIRKLREAMVRAHFSYGKGTLAKLDPTEDYLYALEKDIAPLKGIKVVVDGANGSAGPLAAKAFAALGCLLQPLYCDPDGKFPNHLPDPSQPENLKDLCAQVIKSEAHLGIALDGDGDRMVAVANNGIPLDPDQTMMLFVEQVLTINPAATVVADVKSSRTLTDFIETLGGRSLVCRSGRSFVQSAFRESGALLAGEYSSHYFFGDRWIGFDDGIYAAARLLEILALYNKPMSELVEALPKSFCTAEILVPVPDEDKFNLVQRFVESAHFPGAKLLEIDGLRVEYREAWGLVRASNTSPALTLRFEGRSEGAMEKLKSMFRDQLLALAPELQLDI